MICFDRVIYSFFYINKGGHSQGLVGQLPILVYWIKIEKPRNVEVEVNTSDVSELVKEMTGIYLPLLFHVIWNSAQLCQHVYWVASFVKQCVVNKYTIVMSWNMRFRFIIVVTMRLHFLSMVRRGSVIARVLRFYLKSGL